MEDGGCTQKDTEVGTVHAKRAAYQLADCKRWGGHEHFPIGWNGVNIGVAQLAALQVMYDCHQPLAHETERKRGYL